MSSRIPKRLALSLLIVFGVTHCPKPGDARQWPNPTCPDSVTIPQIQDPDFNPTCKPAVGDTVRGVGGIIIGFDPIATGFDAYIQLAPGGPFSGLDVFFHGVNPTAAPHTLKLGDSIVVEWMRTGEFQNATQVLAPNNNFGAPNGIVRKVSSGNPLPPFFVGTTTQLQELGTNTFAEQYEGCLVRINGPLTVARTSLTGGLGTNAFIVVSASAPSDSVFIDGNKLTAYPPPAVGTTLISVQGIFNQATRGYRIMLRSSADAVPGPYHSITVSTGLGGSVSRTPIGNPLVHGTLVTLEAEPDSGFYFLGWQGDLAGDGNPVAFSLISDLSVTASFDSVGFIVGTSVEGAGAVVRSPEKVQYRPGTVVTLAAVPTQGHRFVGWSGDTTEVASVLTVTVQRVLNFMATFELDPNAAPSSVQATDVPQDQGGAIVLGWNASPLDVLGPGQLLSSYRIDRRASAPAGGGWNAVGLQGALGLPNYSLLLATPADSSSLSNWSFDYRVVALSATDTTQWVSHAVTGWSVDNVPPSSPTSVSGSMASGIATMFWPAVTATDFSEYRIYRGHAIDFVPTAPSRVGTTSETGFTDFAGAFAYYKVTAADTHGNESPGTLFVPSNPVSVEETLLPGSFTIQLQGPTPSNEVPVRIRFGVPSPMTVRIDVVDIQGRVLRQLRAAEANAGWHDLSWDRKDDSGGRVAPGLYFLRAAERSAVHTRRLVLL